MSALTVTLLRSDDELALDGCLEVVEVGNDGVLLLRFADAAGGLAALDDCLAEDIRGTMTVRGPDQEAEYNCQFVQRDGNSVTFQLVCLDD